MDEGEELANSYQMKFIETSAKSDICVEDTFIAISSLIKYTQPTQGGRPTSPKRKSPNESHSLSPILEAQNTDALQKRGWVEDESNEAPEEENDE